MSWLKFIWNTYMVSHIYMVFQLTSLPLTYAGYLWPWMTFKGKIKYNWVFNGLYLLNGACHDQNLLETHMKSYSCIYMVFQLTSWFFNWMTFNFGWPSKVKLGNMEVILSNIWINFTFGKLFTWTGTNNDNIWLPIGCTSDSEQCSNWL